MLLDLWHSSWPPPAEEPGYNHSPGRTRAERRPEPVSGSMVLEHILEMEACATQVFTGQLISEVTLEMDARGVVRHPREEEELLILLELL